MAKPKSEGFPYCQQDTDTFQDVKIRTLIAKFGCDGYAVWDYIKQAAYRENGYYVEWDEERQELTAADLYITTEKTGLIVAYLLKRSLLVSKSFNGNTVLTSHGIQKRFQEMAKSAKRDYYNFIPEVWILSEEETLRFIFCAQKQNNSGIKGDNSGINADNSGIKAQKKRKEKNIYIPSVPSQAPETPQECDEQISFPLIAEEKAVFDERAKAKHRQFVRPTLDEVRAYAIQRGREDLAERFYEYFEIGEWKDSEGKPVKNWKQKFLTWETNGRKTGIASGGEVGGAAKPKDPRWEWTVVGADRKDEREKTRVFEI